MTKENTIIVPRWFLENVENTLWIQNNINLDKETGETCQDRNVRESLNGLRKLLKGEELTGMERLEKLQSSLPSDLDEAAHSYSESDEPLYSPGHRFYWDGESLFGKQIETTFKAGAEWMAKQGVSMEVVRGVPWRAVDAFIHDHDYTEDSIIQIRKK